MTSTSGKQVMETSMVLAAQSEVQRYITAGLENVGVISSAQKGVQGLRFLEFHRTTSSRVEARFPRNLAQKNGISCISKVCESW